MTKTKKLSNNSLHLTKNATRFRQVSSKALCVDEDDRKPTKEEIGMIGDAIATLEWLDKQIGYKRVSAMFDADGKLEQGDKCIKVLRHPLKGNDCVWWYSVEPYKDYKFVRVPINPGGVIEEWGVLKGEKNKRSDYFRYIPVPDGRIYGGEIPNAIVEFMVFGYKPNYLLEKKKEVLALTEELIICFFDKVRKKGWIQIGKNIIKSFKDKLYYIYK